MIAPSGPPAATSELKGASPTAASSSSNEGDSAARPSVRRADARLVSAVGFLAAASFVVQNFGVRIPSAPYLVFEVSDVMTLVASFTMGPFAGFLVVLIRNLLRMLLIHPNAVGLAMNAIGSGTFALVAGHAYRAWRSRPGAIAAMSAGVVAQTLVMAVANAVVLPLYLGLPAGVVVDSTVGLVMGFNLAKGTLTSTLTFLLYKRVSCYLPRLQRDL